MTLFQPFCSSPSPRIAPEKEALHPDTPRGTYSGKDSSFRLRFRSALGICRHAAGRCACNICRFNGPRKGFWFHAKNQYSNRTQSICRMVWIVLRQTNKGVQIIFIPNLSITFDNVFLTNVSSRDSKIVILWYSASLETLYSPFRLNRMKSIKKESHPAVLTRQQTNTLSIMN